MNYKKTSFRIMLMLSYALLSGCGMEDIFDSNQGEIQFKALAVNTRALSYTPDNGTNPITSMGVYAAYTGTSNFDGTQTASYMNNIEVKRTSGNAPWAYDNLKYWPDNGHKLTFFAYAPYATGASGNGIEIPSPQGSGIPSISFSVKDNPIDQVDFLLASSIQNHTKSSVPVSLPFRHALTKIRFSARLKNASTSSIIIRKIELSDLYGKGHTLIESGQPWVPEGNPDKSYTLTDTEGHLKSEPLTTEYVNISTEDGELLLLPQILVSTAKVIVTYDVETGGTVSTKTVESNLSRIVEEWRDGQAINYSFIIEAAATTQSFVINHSFEEWTQTSVDVNVPSDPFLDVTSLSVNTFDAAVSRVYFYTNMPSDQVYIKEQGYLGSSSGSSFNVKEVFDRLTPSEGGVNFHYDPITHEGYFDLVSLQTQNAGTNVRVVTLVAGSLQREITVSSTISVEAAKKDETLYVGTFHRKNERGERIVTWYNEGDWAAEIVKESGLAYDHLLIDRLVSPAYLNGTLYSNNPQGAEGANVSNNQSMISGKGRVYFRVGWDSYANVNRYAKIKVTYSHNGNPQTTILYCRQGEDSDVFGASNLKLAVYNVSLPEEFVDYPTQSGYLYQWNRTQSWEPVGGLTPGAYPVDFETSYDAERYVCPPQYSYPDEVAIGHLKQNQSVWGYYADGFFDRQPITNHVAYKFSSQIGTGGLMFFNPDQGSGKAVFFPTPGYRDATGVITAQGDVAGYWSTVAVAGNLSKSLNVRRTLSSGVEDQNRAFAYNVRCMKLEGVTLFFDANGGDNPPRSITQFGGNVTLSPGPAIPAGALSVFDSWNTLSNGKGTKYLPGQTIPMFAVNTTLYAQWIPNIINMADPNRSESYPLESTNYYVTQTAAIDGEPPYKKLQVSLSFLSGLMTYNEASIACANLGSGWRLPRLSELMRILGQRDLLVGAPFEEMSLSSAPFYYSSSRKSATEVYAVAIPTETDEKPYYYLAQPTTTTSNLSKQRAKFRCVREL